MLCVAALGMTPGVRTSLEAGSQLWKVAKVLKVLNF
jgi:hypothetical protein